MQRRRLCGVVLAMLVSGVAVGGATAQAQAGGVATAAGSKVDPAKTMDGLVGYLEHSVVPAVEAMPAEKFDFRPASTVLPGAMFDGVSTFGDMAKHLAEANYSFFSGVGSMKPDVDVKAIGNLKSKDEIVAALKQSFVFAHKAAATLTPENAWEAAKGPGAQTRASLVGFAVGHGMDHYGQIVEYLRMNGIVPPASRK